MTKNTQVETIRIFCQVHEASFEVPVGPKILCEITGHAMSTGFPSAECWEFCCNCATFTPSDLGKGEMARMTCFACQNEIAKRYVCDSCGTYVFECSSHSKGMRFSLGKAGVGPNCPGCGDSPATNKLARHECKDIGAAFASSLGTCPFCLEKILPTENKSGASSDISDSTVCPQCRSRIVEGAVFCWKCKYRLRADIPVDLPGNDTIQPQALSSLCPNCASFLPKDSSFCGDCGQAVLEAVVPPPPPPPRKKKIEVPAASEITGTPKSNLQTTKTTNDPPVAAIVGSVCIGLVIIFSLLFVAQSSTGSNNSNNINSGGRNTGANANVVMRTPQDYSTVLSEGVERKFSGTYDSGGISLTLTLIRHGSSLEGKAETGKFWDTLNGTIEKSGNFSLEGWEYGTKHTGRYSGRFVSDTEISGSWSLPDGNKQKEFRVYLQ